jgi:hypothetical protein
MSQGFELSMGKGHKTLVEFLTDTFELDVVLRRCDDVLAAVVLTSPNGSRFLFIERTYRDGLRVIEDPAPEEMECAKSGDLWELWNSDRSVYLAGVI